MAMTVAEVSAWMASQGLSESIIRDEAAYIAGHYTGIDEFSDPMAALERSLGSYVQRELSAGDRSEGGYNTDYDDPAIVTDFGTTAARTDSPNVGFDPGAVEASTGTIDYTTGSVINTAKVENEAAAATAYREIVVAQAGGQRIDGGPVQRVAASLTPPTNVPPGGVIRTTTGPNGETLYYVDIPTGGGGTVSPLMLVGAAFAALKYFKVF